MSNDKLIKNGAMLLIFILVVWAIWPSGDQYGGEDVLNLLGKNTRVDGVLLVSDKNGGIEGTLFVSVAPLSGRCVIFIVPPELAMNGVMEDKNVSGDTLPMTLESLYATTNEKVIYSSLERLFGLKFAFAQEVKVDEFYRLIDLMAGLRIRVPNRMSYRATEQQVAPDAPTWLDIPQGENIFFDSHKVRDYLAFTQDGLGRRGHLFRNRRMAISFIERVGRHMQYPWFRDELKSFFPNMEPEAVVKMFETLAALPNTSMDLHFLPGKSDLNNEYYRCSRSRLKEKLPVDFPPEGPVDKRIVIQLLNGSGKINAASKVREMLYKFPDVDVVEIGNATHFNYKHTKIISRRRNNEKAAVRIRELLGIGMVEQEPDLSAQVDVTVIIGRDLL